MKPFGIIILDVLIVRLCGDGDYVIGLLGAHALVGRCKAYELLHAS